MTKTNIAKSFKSVRNWFYSSLAFCTALVLLLLGVVGMVIPWLPAIKESLLRFIEEDRLVITLIGFTLLVLGSLLITYLLARSKRRYYTIRSGNNSIAVHEYVLHEYLHSYLKQLFPENDIPFRLVIKRQKLLITADLPHMPAPEQSSLIGRINEDIGELLAKKIGYTRPFYLSVSFSMEEPASHE